MEPIHMDFMLKNCMKIRDRQFDSAYKVIYN